MRRGTTPARALTIEGIDLTEYSYEVIVKQGGVRIIKQDEECDLTVVTDENEDPVSVINFSMTQDETNKLSPKRPVAFQVRYINEEGYAGATTTASENVFDILREGVINYE